MGGEGEDQSKMRTWEPRTLPLHRTDDEGLARLEEKEKHLKALGELKTR